MVQQSSIPATVKPLYKEWWMYLIIAVFVVVAYLVIPKGSVQLNPYSNVDELAVHLSDVGAMMYGTEWCPHCKAQKELFGSSFKKINYIDCDIQKEVCLANLVTGYPTWKINGQNYPGTQSLETLAQLTNFELIAKE